MVGSTATLVRIGQQNPRVGLKGHPPDLVSLNAFPKCVRSIHEHSHCKLNWNSPHEAAGISNISKQQTGRALSPAMKSPCSRNNSPSHPITSKAKQHELGIHVTTPTQQLNKNSEITASVDSGIIPTSSSAKFKVASFDRAWC